MYEGAAIFNGKTYVADEIPKLAADMYFEMFAEKGYIESVVGIEIHNRMDYKPAPALDNVFVLMIAYRDGGYIIPVKLEIKKFKDKQNTLYVAISLEKIKMTEVWKQGNTKIGVTQNSRSVNVRMVQIFKKINPSDKNGLPALQSYIESKGSPEQSNYASVLFLLGRRSSREGALEIQTAQKSPIGCDRALASTAYYALNFILMVGDLIARGW